VAQDLFYVAVGTTLCFAFVHGFHDGGNVIATIICSRTMRPGTALFLAAVAEFIGPLVLGTAVARTMAGSILKPDIMANLRPEKVYLIVISGVGGAVFWKLPTWHMGLPSSGSHAIIGGLVGAGLVCMGTQGIVLDSIIRGVVLPLLLSPLLGLLIGMLVFSLIRALFGRLHRGVGHMFSALQKPIMLVLAASHGSNDAQKSMGVLALVLAAGTAGLSCGELDLPEWVVWGCAAAMAIGLAAGSWRIVKTVGVGICRMEPVHSFAGQLTAMSVIMGASLTGGPVSTAQVVASSVMGVGASRRLSGVRWSAAANIAYAWLLTAPVSAGLGAGGYWCLSWTIQLLQ
jgi:PiT family inorganic phosphate transporter